MYPILIRVGFMSGHRAFEPGKSLYYAMVKSPGREFTRKNTKTARVTPGGFYIEGEESFYFMLSMMCVAYSEVLTLVAPSI